MSDPVGLTSAIESGRAGAVNPFYVAIQRVNELKQQKDDFNQKLELESVNLSGMFQKMAKQYDYDTKLEELKSKKKMLLEERKAELNPTQGGSLQDLQSLFGGSVPPGTTASFRGPGGSKITTPLNRELTTDESRATTGAEEMLVRANRLKETIQGNKDKGLRSPQVMSLLPFAGGDPTAQQYKQDINYFSDTLLRLRSGAQINEQEYKRLRRLLPRLGTADEVDITTLNDFMREFSAVKGRIETGALWNPKSKSFEGGTSQSTGNKIGRFTVEAE